jgi:hypothetical protein
MGRGWGERASSGGIFWIPFPCAAAPLRPGMTRGGSNGSSPAARSAGKGIQGHLAALSHKPVATHSRKPVATRRWSPS